LIAVRRHNLELTTLLLQEGADPNISDRMGEGPLREAVCAGNLKMVKLLIKFSADIKSRDIDGHSPLSLALNSRFKGISEFLQKGLASGTAVVCPPQKLAHPASRAIPLASSTAHQGK